MSGSLPSPVDRSALELHAVRKVYGGSGPGREGGTVALAHADLTVGHGEIVALLGPSGSGKTTLLSIAGGLLTATAGNVVVGGHDITGYSPKQLTEFRRTKVGFVFQAVNLVPFLTAEENLLVVAELAGGGRGNRKKARQRARALLGELGLTERAGNLPGQLSGGERQRVAIGRALFNSPSLVLFDEPTSALDTKIGEQVMDLIQHEMRSRGTAAVIVTHDNRMTHYADRTVHITDGVLEAGS
jgi:putative ABC transport system ATP-binding protein